MASVVGTTLDHQRGGKAEVENYRPQYYDSAVDGGDSADYAGGFVVAETKNLERGARVPIDLRAVNRHQSACVLQVWS